MEHINRMQPGKIVPVTNIKLKVAILIWQFYKTNNLQKWLNKRHISTNVMTEAKKHM